MSAININIRQNSEKRIAKFSKDFSKDYYVGLKRFYFYRVLKKVIEIGDLRNRKIKILDFGCGTGKLKTLLPQKVINYDINPELTEVSDWRKAKFNVVVANAVFYLMTEKELRIFLSELYKYNPKLELIFVTSKRNIINQVLKYLSSEHDAWDDTTLQREDELKILTDKMKIIKKINVYFMAEVYLMKFKIKN